MMAALPLPVQLALMVLSVQLLQSVVGIVYNVDRAHHLTPRLASVDGMV